MFSNPVQQITQASHKISNNIPLCSLDLCRYKQCRKDKKDSPNGLDNYWSEFLKSQEQSTANYLYGMQIFGTNVDPTLLKSEPFPIEIIRQRLDKMPLVGGLHKEDQFYLLSFILNILTLDVEKQERHMEVLQDRGMLNKEILNYLQFIAKLPNAGVEAVKLRNFLLLCQRIEGRTSTPCNTCYFHPKRLLMKMAGGEMDPYELNYLKILMNTEEDLTSDQYTYLLTLVEMLREMSEEMRLDYLKVLYNKNIIPSTCFRDLCAHLRKKSKHICRAKLQNLLSQLEILMDIQPCFPMAKIVPLKHKEEHVLLDVRRTKKALKALMTAGIPNIIRTLDLKKFLQDLLILRPEQMDETLLQLKNMHLLSIEELKFIGQFMLKEPLEGAVQQKESLMKSLQKVAATPPSTNPSPAILCVPSIKGPVPVLVNYK